MALRAGWLDGMSVDDAIAVGKEHGMTSLEAKVKGMLSAILKKVKKPVQKRENAMNWLFVL